MFKFLKEKFSGWLGKKEPAEVKRDEPSKRVKKVEPHAKKTEKKSKPKKAEIEKILKKKSEAFAEEVPLAFDVAKQKFEPVPDEIRKKEQEIVKNEFVREKVDARAEELEDEIEANEAGEKGEVLDKDEVDKEIKEKKGFFGFLAKKLTTSELSEEDFDLAFDEFEFALLENNVALGVVDKIREGLKKELVGKRFGKKEVEGKILEALRNSISSLLVEPPSLIEQIKAKKDGPFVILFFGINGSGKTTSIAKLAWKLKKLGYEPVLAAGDTFRAASIEQLETHASKIGVEIVRGDYGKDPAAVAFDAISYARKMHKKVVLIDTAGRMYTRANLMKEMEKIVKVSKPDLKIFVGESITGNDATEQARMFNETAGIDGIILSKADVDEKAGTILSVSFVTGKPIYFLGVGQEYGDLQEFSKKNVFRNLGLE